MGETLTNNERYSVPYQDIVIAEDNPFKGLNTVQDVESAWEELVQRSFVSFHTIPSRSPYQPTLPQHNIQSTLALIEIPARTVPFSIF